MNNSSLVLCSVLISCLIILASVGCSNNISVPKENIVTSGKSTEQTVGSVTEPDVPKTPEQKFAIKSASAVDSRLAAGIQLRVSEAFVRMGEDYDECMLYAKPTDSENEKTDMYRVVIYHGEPNVINVYYTIDAESPEFLAMYNSDDSKEREFAGGLKSFSDAIIAADKEIRTDSSGWTNIDCALINSEIKKSNEKSEN